MLATLNVLFMGLVLGGLPLWVIWGWVTWVKNARPFQPRTLVSLLALACASLSATLEVGSMLHAQLSGAGAPDTSTALHVTGIALAGLALALSLSSFRTPRTPRWTTPALALVMLAIWVLNVCAQGL
jgi:hypothetical protein